jgi:UDP-glucose 4-epimerase
MDQNAGPMASEEIIELAAKFSGRRVLITGGLGFIGSNLGRILSEAGARVILLDALVPGHGGSRFNVAGLEDDLEVHVADVREIDRTRAIVNGCDTVFSLAGQSSHLDSMRDPYTDLFHNCHGPLAVLEACRHVAPEAVLVFAGTRQVYGRPRYIPVDEEHPISPVDVNGVHKWAAETYHQLYRDVYGTRTVVLRLTNTYGPRMRVLDARQTFLGLWIRRLLTGDELEVYGDGTQLRDFNYVDDAIRAFLLAATHAETTGEVFNVGDERAISLADLAELLIAINGAGDYRLVDFPPDRRAIDIGDYQGDFSRIRTTLGWSPRVSLEEGLERTLEFFAQHGPQYWGDES